MKIKFPVRVEEVRYESGLTYCIRDAAYEAIAQNMMIKEHAELMVYLLNRDHQEWVRTRSGLSELSEMNEIEFGRCDEE